MAGDRTMDLLILLRGGEGGPGLKIVKVETTEPDAITLSFEGTKLALDLTIFEVPVSLYPLCKGDRFFTFPIAGGMNRWGLIEKINGGVAMATMQSASSLKIDGITKTYSSTDLIIPPYFAVGNAASSYSGYNGASDSYLKAANVAALKAGDRVSIAPTLDGVKIKYVILNKY